jgi:hypothetical protein
VIPETEIKMTEDKNAERMVFFIFVYIILFKKLIKRILLYTNLLNLFLGFATFNLSLSLFRYAESSLRFDLHFTPSSFCPAPCALRPEPLALTPVSYILFLQA